MGYFGPIGAGAVFYLEHSRHLFPELGEGDEEETNLVRAMGPVVYWLVLFSIVVHGLSIPGLNIVYHYMGVKPIKEDAVSLRRASVRAPTPVNAEADGDDAFVVYNRFSRSVFNSVDLSIVNGSSNLANKQRTKSEPSAPTEFPADDEVEMEKKRAQRRIIRYMI